jgi:hypothetical protein
MYEAPVVKHKGIEFRPTDPPPKVLGGEEKREGGREGEGRGREAVCYVRREGGREGGGARK